LQNFVSPRLCATHQQSAVFVGLHQCHENLMMLQSDREGEWDPRGRKMPNFAQGPGLLKSTFHSERRAKGMERSLWNSSQKPHPFAKCATRAGHPPESFVPDYS
jgi:hypothetical protein